MLDSANAGMHGMVMTLNRLSAALACLLSVPALALAAPDDSRVPPAPQCLDARDVRQVEQDTPTAIAVRDGKGQPYRIDFSAACPGVNAAVSLRLEAPEGWACGRPGERVVVDGHTCAVAGVSLIDNRAFAETARESSRQYAATLPAVTVTAKGKPGRSGARHAFQGSAASCFATRNVRSWSEDPQGVLIETNPLRNGGHRYYRVELGGSCTLLDGAQAIDFQSGFQNGLICGNPGDRIVMADPGTGIDVGMSDVRASTPRFARPGCAVLAVYPKN